MYTTTIANSAGRFAYIYSSGLLGGLKHGDSIFSISFYKDNTDSLVGSNIFKIYIRPTTQTDFGISNLSWGTEIASVGFAKVFDNNPNSIINGKRGFITFEFNSPYHWDTTLGTNLEILVEYYQPTAQSVQINWAYDNSATQSGYLSNQTKLYIATNVPANNNTLSSSNERKPMIRINYPRFNKEIGAISLYSLGKIPVPLGNPDTVKVLLLNSGKQDVVNQKAYLYSYGANKFVDTLDYNLSRNEQALFAFPIRTLQNIGMDTLVVILEPDGISSNDTIDNLREATLFTYSYRNLKEPPAPGGIGFNGSTGDFVAKFISSQTKAINQVSVMFGFGGEPFKIGIWDATGPQGKPGNLIWQSDSQTSKAGEFILPVWPPVKVTGTFFVGVRQIGLSNVAFGFQYEDPVRNGTFFHASPLGSTSWNDFSPDAPFRFMIEPRIQAENDITPLSFDFPNDTLIAGTYDTLSPKATIRNIGTNDQNVAFETQCNIRYFGGTLVYTSSIFDTLSSGSNRQITFDKSFFPTFSGEYSIEIITKLLSDQFKQNDTLYSRILAGRQSDVGMTLVFTPQNAATYQYYIDTILPTVKADNFGFDDRTFLVYGEIYDSNNVLLWQDIATKSVKGGQSVTVGFKEYIPMKIGKFKFVTYTKMTGDTDTQNDTLVRYFFVGKDNDVALNFVLEPIPSNNYPKNTLSITPKVNIKNLGSLHQLSYFPVICDIYNQNILVFTDTAMLQVFIDDSTTLSFSDSFTNPPDGLYRAFFRTALSNDQETQNDTLTVYFKVGSENDIEVVSINKPTNDSSLHLSYLYRPNITVRNNGFKNQLTPFPIIFQSYDSSGTIIQTIQRNITISANSMVQFDFDSIFKARPEGVISVKAFSSLPSDEIKSNDTAFIQYTVQKTYDFEVIGRIKNNPMEEIEVKSGSYKPTIIIRNNSRLESDSVLISVTIWTPNNEIIYNYIRSSYPNLYGGLDTVFFPEYIPEIKGFYKLSVSLFQISDQNPFNDTLSFGFESILNYDLEVSEIVTPKNNDTIYLDKGIPPYAAVKITNNGNENPNNALLHISLLDANNNELKTDSLAISPSLSYLATQTLVFNDFFKSFNFSNESHYKIRATIEYPQDQIVDNNVLESNFFVAQNSSIHSISFSNGILSFPNPFENFIQINLIIPDTYSISLYSAGGKTVFEGKTNSLDYSFTISTQNLSSGVYYLKLNNGKHIFAAKFIKL
ncbi:MAG: T9SS type A sorting domain-containing protein [Bacteroidetes bacterium]|nr:T9SS type A sorting domain-containing protein [Bacteroidota bacterium]